MKTGEAVGKAAVRLAERFNPVTNSPSAPAATAALASVSICQSRSLAVRKPWATYRSRTLRSRKPGISTELYFSLERKSVREKTMRLLQFCAFLGMTAVVVFFGSVRIGVAPPPGRFLDPFGGFWRSTAPLAAQERLTLASLRDPVVVRYDDRRNRFWGELQSRFVDRQDRVSEAFAEQPTPGFAVFDLRGGVPIGQGLTLTVAVENLFDEAYAEHLNRMHKVDGTPLLEPGRNLHIMLTVGI